MRLLALAAGLATIAATPALALTVQQLPAKPDVAQRLKPSASAQPWNGGGSGNFSFSYSVRNGDGATSYNSYGSPRTTLSADPLPTESQIRDQSYDTPYSTTVTGRREQANPLSLTLPRR